MKSVHNLPQFLYLTHSVIYFKIFELFFFFFVEIKKKRKKKGRGGGGGGGGGGGEGGGEKYKNLLGGEWKRKRIYRKEFV